MQAPVKTPVDIHLRAALLRQLRHLERSLQSGVPIVVQPHVEGLLMTNPVGLAGYEIEVVEAHLRTLLVERLIENGGLHHPNIGIHFARLTRRGRVWLLAHETGAVLPAQSDVT